MGHKRKISDPRTSLAVVAFVALFGSVTAHSEWNKELDIVDFATMDLPSAWGEWKEMYPEMPIQDDFQSFSRFVTNLQIMAGHNSDTSQTYKMAPNQFSHFDTDEFRLYIHGDKGSCLSGVDKKIPILNKLFKDKNTGKVNANPASVDWTTQGVVTPVKNQGQCGSCWAFSATGSLECQYAINKGTLTSLSEQQLVDCSHRYGNLGCSGGQMDAAFKYVEANGGLCSESEYPYKASGESCQESSCGTTYDANSGYTDVTPRSETSLETAAAAGCVSVAIEADQYAFQSYSSGVLTGSCGTNLDHGVLVVGYGTDSGTEYWKVKNSWGKTWGEEGYVRICKDCSKNGSQGECGILDDPSYPTF